MATINSTSKTLIIAIVAVMLTFFGNGIISFVTSNKVADKVVTEDHIRIENINNDIDEINVNINDIGLKLDELNEDKLSKKAFEEMVITLKGQLESTNQMIIAIEKQNKVNYGRFQQRYDDLEEQFNEIIEKYNFNQYPSKTTAGGVVR
jgi:hypothetical protein